MTDEETDLVEVFDQLETLEDTVDSPDEREQVRETMRLVAETSRSGGSFGRVIWGFDRGDLAETLLGSILFGIPMAVEGGTHDVGTFLAVHPVYLIGTALFPVALTTGILYVADIQDVRIRDPIFGQIPRRLVGVLGVSLLTAGVLLTVWGRVTWSMPAIAFAYVLVAFVPMSIGAALGDILPGS